MHDDLDARIRLACTLDLVDGEALVHRAEAFPQDHLRVGVHGRVFGTTGRLVRIPHWHLVKAHTHGESGIAAKVLVREEQHALAAGECPFEHGMRIG